MTNPTPQGLPPLPAKPKREDRPALNRIPYEVFTSAQLDAYAIDYAREALAAQAATLESIHKIIECAGPEAADEIADLLGYPSVEWPSDQAASVEPVGEVGSMPGTSGFTMACFKAEDVPIGTKLYAGAPPSPASVPVLVTSVMGLDVYDTPDGKPAAAVDADRVLNLADRYRCAQAGRDAQQARTLLEAALQASHQPQQGGGAAMREALRLGVECTRF